MVVADQSGETRLEDLLALPVAFWVGSRGDLDGHRHARTQGWLDDGQLY